MWIDSSPMKLQIFQSTGIDFFLIAMAESQTIFVSRFALMRILNQSLNGILMESKGTKVRKCLFGLLVGDGADLSNNNPEIIVECCLHFFLSGSKGHIAKAGLLLI